jgi:hypothetical protein
MDMVARKGPVSKPVREGSPKHRHAETTAVSMPLLWDCPSHLYRGIITIAVCCGTHFSRQIRRVHVRQTRRGGAEGGMRCGAMSSGGLVQDVSALL